MRHSMKSTMTAVLALGIGIGLVLPSSQAIAQQYPAPSGTAAPWGGYSQGYVWQGYAPGEAWAGSNVYVAVPPPAPALASAPVYSQPYTGWQGYAPASAWVGYAPARAWEGYVPVTPQYGALTERLGGVPGRNVAIGRYRELGSGRNVPTIKPWLPPWD